MKAVGKKTPQRTAWETSTRYLDEANYSNSAHLHLVLHEVRRHSMSARKRRHDGRRQPTPAATAIGGYRATVARRESAECSEQTGSAA
jgi:hypothetical protein